jgi:hypothetical protein
MAENDDVNNAEAFDEDLLVEEGADDTDVASDYPPDHYEGVRDPAVTEAGDARIETIQERVLREEADPVVEELDRNALAEDLEDEAYRATGAAPTTSTDAPINAQLADIDDAALDGDQYGEDPLTTLLGDDALSESGLDAALAADPLDEGLIDDDLLVDDRPMKGDR